MIQKLEKDQFRSLLRDALSLGSGEALLSTHLETPS